MDKTDILISDLKDIKEILDNNGYAMWGKRLFDAVKLLMEQRETIETQGTIIEQKQNQVTELLMELERQEKQSYSGYDGSFIL